VYPFILLYLYTSHSCRAKDSYMNHKYCTGVVVQTAKFINEWRQLAEKILLIFYDTNYLAGRLHVDVTAMLPRNCFAAGTARCQWAASSSNAANSCSD
jgi:hypothetical protein